MIITEELINNFLEYKRNEGLKEKTLYRFRYDFMAFYRWLCENKKDRIECIDKLTIEEYKHHLFSLWGSKKSRYWIQNSLCSWTINQKLLVIKHFFEYINYIYDIGIDYRKIKLNKVKYRTGDYFTEEEIREILRTIDKTEKYRINQLRFKLIVLVCFVSGSRLNELRQITIKGIKNWKQKIVWKWDKERYLFFNRECIEVLEEYIEEQQKPLPRLWRIVKRINDYAICSHWYNSFGDMIWKQAITEMFKKLNKYLNREKIITCHTLRHSFATFMVDHWTNVFHLKELMWHEKINTTAWYYHRNWNILFTEQQQVFSNLII